MTTTEESKTNKEEGEEAKTTKDDVAETEDSKTKESDDMIVEKVETKDVEMKETGDATTKVEETTEDGQTKDGKAKGKEAKDAEAEESKTKETDDKIEEKNDSKPDAKVVEAVAERLRFFFSDANLRQDRFMRRWLLMETGTKYPRQVTIESLLRFNTIKTHTTDPRVVIEAAKTLLSDKLVVSDDGEAIGRVVPFTWDMMEKNIPLSLYVKNLPVQEGEGEKQPRYLASVDDVRALFDQYGKIALVKLRFKFPEDEENGSGRWKDKGYRQRSYKGRIPAGSGFVEFETLEAVGKAAEDVLTMKGGEKVEPKRKLKLGDNDLEVILLKEHVDAKRAENPEEAGGANNRQLDGGDDNAGEKDTKNDNKMEGDEEKEYTFDWKPGCVIRLKGLADNCDREAIIDAVAKGLDIPLKEVKTRSIYMDYSRGQTDGAIRFKEPSEDVARICKQFADGQLTIKDAKVESATVLSGEEESEYWKKFIDFKRKHTKHKADESSHHHRRLNRHKKPRKKY